jgi:long-chain acyl-CoA synthetase
LGSTEQVKRIEILGREWTIESGELTANLKMRRKFINEKYGNEIRQLFEG